MSAKVLSVNNGWAILFFPDMPHLLLALTTLPHCRDENSSPKSYGYSFGVREQGFQLIQDESNWVQ